MQLSLTGFFGIHPLPPPYKPFDYGDKRQVFSVRLKKGSRRSLREKVDAISRERVQLNQEHRCFCAYTSS